MVSYELIEDAGIERLFESSAVPELLVVVVEALPVLAEVLGAVVVDVVEPVRFGQSRPTRRLHSALCMCVC